MPNTPTDWKTTVTTTDPVLEVLWTRVMGKNEVPVTSILSQPVKVQSVLLSEPIIIDAYLLDWQALSPDQQQRIVDWIATEFKADPKEVRADIEEHGLPIRANDCFAHTTDPAVLHDLID
jgi:hypothetical protein